MTDLEKRRSYQAPELIQYGELTSLTGAIVCTGSPHKAQTTDIDDATEGYGFLGDPYCVK